MVEINVIYVIHTTRTLRGADTDADFELIVERPGGDLRRPFPGLEHNERELGRTDSYAINVRENSRTLNWNPTMNIVMRMTSTNDAWLPESIFVIGIGPGTPVLMGAHSGWSINKWFDRGAGKAGPEEHIISGFG